MPSKLPEISVIIVNYRADKWVRNIRRALRGHDDIEVIVIDNSSGDAGYGAGCNRGAERAHGETLVFCNPDIEVTADSVRELHSFLQTHPQVGMVGPQILRDDGTIEISCSMIPSPLLALVEYSWLRQLPGLRSYSHKYRLQSFDHDSSRPVPVISGSCFALRREDYRAIGGCDEKLFLYFEEFDLAQRTHTDLDKQVYFLSSTSIIHYGQISTDQTRTASRHFRRSRRYWFQKIYGWRGSLVVTMLEWFEKVSG